MKPLFITIFERLAAGSLRVWLIAGILLRLTHLRDRFQPFALIYYTTPWPAIACGLAILALHAKLRRQAHVSRRYVILCGGALFIWFALSWHSAPAPTEQPTLRVALWNVARPGARVSHLVGWLRAQQADVMAIAEGEGTSKAADWAKLLPEYQTERINGEMLCFVKGEVLSREEGLVADRSYYTLLKTRVHGQPLTILQADIYGSPTYSRRPALAELHRLAQQHAGERLLVLGDFNTPADSANFTPWREDLTHAFETAGHGLMETWPMPFPMLSLDHLWTNSHLRPIDCHIGLVWWSDHRPVVADFVEGH